MADIPNTIHYICWTLLIASIAFLFIEIKYLEKKAKLQEEELQHLLDLEDKRREFDAAMAQWSLDVDEYLIKLTNHVNQREGDKPTFH